MTEKLSYLKRSEFIVGLFRALRGLERDSYALYWISRRHRRIVLYLRTHATKKLQLGSSNKLLEGWLNTDICIDNHSLVYLDAARRFPFDDNTFHYIMAEHMIEHLEYPAGQVMLRECFRVLKPGGRVRLATPDLRVLLALNSPEKTEAQRNYIEWAIARSTPEVQECKDVFVINNFFRSWGHCFLYDQETLHYALSTAGFRGIKFYKPGNSDDPNLRNLESHGLTITEDINQYETTVVEGSKEK